MSTVQLPPASAVTIKVAPPTTIVIWLPGSAVPLIVGFTLFVTRLSTVGTIGSVVSIVNSSVDASEMLQLLLSLATCTSLTPFVFGAKVPLTGVSAPVSIVQPVAVATVVYVAPPTITVILLPLSALPDISGVVSLVVCVVTVGVVG